MSEFDDVLVIVKSKNFWIVMNYYNYNKYFLEFGYIPKRYVLSNGFEDCTIDEVIEYCTEYFEAKRFIVEL